MSLLKIYKKTLLTANVNKFLHMTLRYSPKKCMLTVTPLKASRVMLKNLCQDRCLPNYVFLRIILLTFPGPSYPVKENHIG